MPDKRIDSTVFKYCIAILLLFVLCFGLPLQAYGQQQARLSDLEKLVGEGVEAQTALAELETQMARVDRADSMGLPTFFGVGGYSKNREAVTAGSNETVDYNQRYASVGISIPVLGDNIRNKMSRLEVVSNAARAEQRLISVKAANLAALRRGWIIIWCEQNKQNLLERYLDTENTVRGMLQKRVDAGASMPSEMYRILSYYDAARQELAYSRELSDKAASVVSKSTGRSVRGMTLPAPDLPRVKLGEDTAQWLWENHPEIMRLNEAAQSMEERRKYAKFSDIDVKLQSSFNVTDDLPGAMGHAWQVGVLFELPLNFFSLAGKQDKVAAAEEAQVRRLGKALESELRESLIDAMSACERGDKLLASARSNMCAAREALRVSKKRFNNLGAEGVLQVLDARNAYLQSAVGAMDFTSQALQSRADLLRYAEWQEVSESTRRDSLAEAPIVADMLKYLTNARSDFSFTVGGKHTAAPEKQPNRADAQAPSLKYSLSGGNAPGETMQLGVYAWDAAPFLGESYKRELAAVRSAGFGRILLGLDGAQIDKAAQGRGRVKRLLDEAHRQGLTVELLLGDPNWILPEQRQGLFDIIATLSRYKFDGLHLDLEQNQLPGEESRRQEYARLTGDTILAAAERSPWPVGFSVHHRYLDPKGNTPEFRAMFNGQKKIREIAVMAYITNESVLGNVLRPISAVQPAPGSPVLTLALSFEKSESPDNSHFQSGKGEFFAFMQTIWERYRRAVPGGMLVQSWENFK